jgi:PAS domain S-box-containing protein
LETEISGPVRWQRPVDASAVIAAAGDAIVTYTLEGVITSWNPGAQRIYGYTAPEIVGRSAAMVTPADRWDEMKRVLTRLRFGESIDLYETVQVRSDGRELRVSLSIFPIRDEHGLVIAGSAVARDITPRKLAEEERDQFFALSPDLLCVTTADDSFHIVNPAWKSTLGYEYDDLVAQPYVNFFTLVHPEDEVLTRAEIAKLRSGAITVSFENRFRGKDGMYRWLLWSATKHPERGRIYATARDISDRQLARQLAAANAELEAFTYSVSHDLKEPLRTIEAFSQFLVHDYSEILPPDALDFLVRINRASVRMKRLIDDLLTIARTAHDAAAPTAVKVGSVVDDVKQAMHALIEERNASIEMAGELPGVMVDRHRLEQIISNLVGNALKYNQSVEPRVEIGLRSADADEVTLFVKDNGIGIAPQFHERIFGIFQRLHRREEYEGTGAGLAIVQRAVEASGGRIWVESAEGEGSTFLFTLPGVPAGTAQLPARTAQLREEHVA